MIVKIDKLSHDFKGITRVNDKVVFTKNTLPGEVVDIRIVKEKNSYAEGKLFNVIEGNIHRIKNECPYAELCGGCNFSYVDYKEALNYKKESVKDIIKKYADIEVNPGIIPSDRIDSYRNKISLKVFNGALALCEEESNNLVNINKCLLVNDNINEVIELLGSVSLTGINEIIIKGTEELMVIINGERNIEEIINIIKDKVSSIIYNEKLVYGSDYITINVDKFKYAVYPKSFFQINTNMISKLYDKVKEYAGVDNSLLDLYCGAGTIGIYLSDNFKEVRGVEVNKDAITSANINKKINNINNISFECTRAGDINKIDADVVVVDPPRSGLDNNTIKMLLDSNVKKIVYVSCNPITLARDLNLLKTRYELKDITLFDMFPKTVHVECVSVLYRKSLEK